MSSAFTHTKVDFDEYRKNSLFIGTERAVLIFLGGSFFRLFWRDPKSGAKPRYELKKLGDLSLLMSEPSKYFDNVFYVWDDGFVGQYFKDKYMVWKESTGTIKQSRKCEPFGVLGNLYSVLIVNDKVQKSMKNVGKVAAAFLGYAALKEGWVRYLFDKEDKATGLDINTEAKIISKSGLYTPESIIAKYKMDTNDLQLVNPIP